MLRCDICGCNHEPLYVHCTKCKTLVHKDMIPPKSQGRCWRCEITHLRNVIKQLDPHPPRRRR